jgi:hypothetical protein
MRRREFIAAGIAGATAVALPLALHRRDVVRPPTINAGAPMPASAEVHAGSDVIYPVPLSIPSDGSADAAAALRSWIASVPDGTASSRSVLQFSGGTYRIDSLLHLTSRSYLLFHLGGATLKWAARPDDARRLLWFTTCTGITVRSGKLLGTYAYPASGDAFVPAYQHMHAVCVDQSSCDVYDCAISGFYGDGVDFTNEAGTSRTSSGRISSCNIWKVGRNAISAVCADGVLLDHNRIQQTGYWGVDCEPNAGQTAACRNVTVDHNTWGGQGGATSRVVFGVVPRAAVSDITFTNNAILGRDASMWINFNGTDVVSTRYRPTGITIAGNGCDTISQPNVWPVFSADGVSANNDSIPVSGGTALALHDVAGFAGNDLYTRV